MKVERAGDLMFVTYYMINWREEKQFPSERLCTECGKEMSRLEAAVADSASDYEGLVCHGCKRVVWIKQG